MIQKNEKWLWITLGSLGILSISIALIYRKQISATVHDVVDYVFSEDLEKGLKKLHPKAQNKFRSFIKDLQDLGYDVILTSGYRTFQEQIKLKKENSSNAQAGLSHHNYGTGIDINVKKGTTWLRKASSKADWEKSGIPKLAKDKYNLRWGGDFNSYHDPVHFDFENIYHSSDLYADAIKQFGSADKTIGNKVNIT